MTSIARIVIKGSSGYFYCCESYEDKITITQDSIAYEYVPIMEVPTNPKRKWSYKTNSPIFKMRYDEISSMITGIMERDTEEMYLDVGTIEFIVTYSDKSKLKKIYVVPGDYFKDLFMKIKELVPDCEYTPAVLLTSEDYDEAADEC